MATDSEILGQRLAAQGSHLRLLLAHLAGRAVRARVELDDLMQEVFVRALGSGSVPPSGDDEAPLRRFLGRLARNAVVDVARELRAAKRDGRALRLTLAGSNPDGLRASALLARTAGPSTRVQGAEAAARLQARFERLPSEYRRVIGLRQLEGLSAREAARRMGRSEVAVHSLYRRALVAWGEGEKAGKSDESPSARRPDPP